jgi:hypothetical protein
MENKNIETFVFCWYPKGLFPRAIIVDYSKFSAKTKDDIEFLVAHGNLIEAMYDVEHYKTCRSYTLTGYKSNDKIFNFTENEHLSNIISTWRSYADQLHMYIDDDGFQELAEPLIIESPIDSTSPIQDSKDSDSFDDSFKKSCDNIVANIVNPIDQTIKETDKEIGKETGKKSTEDVKEKNEWMHHAYEYYMNDVNANFRPEKLHEVLSKMTCLPLSSDYISQGTESTIFNIVF